MLYNFAVKSVCVFDNFTGDNLALPEVQTLTLINVCPDLPRHIAIIFPHHPHSHPNPNPATVN